MSLHKIFFSHSLDLDEGGRKSGGRILLLLLLLLLLVLVGQHDSHTSSLIRRGHPLGSPRLLQS
jgi:hypothetical protein